MVVGVAMTGHTAEMGCTPLGPKQGWERPRPRPHGQGCRRAGYLAHLLSPELCLTGLCLAGGSGEAAPAGGPEMALVLSGGGRVGSWSGSRRALGQGVPVAWGVSVDECTRTFSSPAWDREEVPWCFFSHSRDCCWALLVASEAASLPWAPCLSQVHVPEQ